MELSIVIPALNEEKNVEKIIPAIHERITYSVNGSEIIIVDGGSTDKTCEVARSLGARVLSQKERGYGGALIAGFGAANGEYILTMDADLSHSPVFFHNMYRQMQHSEVVIASRYVKGGRATMPRFRKLLSLILNQVFARGLSLPLKDVSSGFRLYKASALRNIEITSRDFDVLEEIIIKIYTEGYKIAEVPFDYEPRIEGKSHAKLIKFAIAYLKTFGRMWKLRNSIDSADYDERAYNSIIPLQRWWQRRRYRIVKRFAQSATRTLDIGCGSSHIFTTLSDPVGLDIRLNKVRYMRKHGRPLVNGTIFDLPFKDETFDCVICSQVIEHIQDDMGPFNEITRVLRHGGILVLGTPDYDKTTWLAIEKVYSVVAPGGYADEHITHYTRNSLSKRMESLGYEILDLKYVFGSEMIFLLRKNKCI